MTVKKRRHAINLRRERERVEKGKTMNVSIGCRKSDISHAKNATQNVFNTPHNAKCAFSRIHVCDVEKC